MDKLTLIDGNNVLRRYFETQGPTAMQELFMASITGNPNHRLIWVWDGKQAKARRQAVFPQYKEGRNPATDEFYRTREFFSDLLGHSSCLQFQCDGWEADDVIATLAKGVTNCQVIIDSNDADFFSLLSNPNITLQRDKVLPVDPEDMLLFKALVGDNSDNIKGIARFGPKGFEKLTSDDKSLLIRCLDGEIEPSEVLETLPMTPAVAKSFIQDIDTIRAGYQIIQFYTVPDEDLKAGLWAGSLDTCQANAKLAQIYAEALPPDAHLSSLNY